MYRPGFTGANPQFEFGTALPGRYNLREFHIIRIRLE
jgi:hypothetical protein